MADKTLENHKFTSVGTVSTMMSRNHKHLNFDKGDLIEWCWEAVQEIGNYDSFREIFKYKIQIRQGRAQLPCGVFRLLRVWMGGKPLRGYDDDGVYIRPTNPSVRNGEIEVDFIGVPVDKDGYPAIDVQSVQYCYWYCYKKLMWDNWANAEINANVWADINKECDYWREEARGSFRNKSHDHLDHVMEVLYTFVKTPAMDRNLINYGRDNS